MNEWRKVGSGYGTPNVCKWVYQEAVGQGAFAQLLPFRTAKRLLKSGHSFSIAR